MDYSYDNSEANPRNPSRPARRVRFGQESTDEMAELWIQVMARDAAGLSALERDFNQKIALEWAEYYQHRLRLDPADATAHTRLGQVMQKRGQFNLALDHWRKASELAPRDAEPHLLMGVFFLNQSRLKEAEEELEIALNLDPESSVAHGNLGILCMSQGRLSKARAHLQRALQLNPGDAAARDNLEQIRRALEGSLP